MDTNHASMLDLDVPYGRARSHRWSERMLSGRVSPGSTFFLPDSGPVPNNKPGNQRDGSGLHCIP